MKKYLWVGVVIVIAVGAVLLWQRNYFIPKDVAPVASLTNQNQKTAVVLDDPQTTVESPTQLSSDLQAPLNRSKERVTKKPFGIFITPQNSPVQPEKFYGYHTGTDFEIFPEELDADVSIRAICPGKLASKRTASGYGGVVVEICAIDAQPVTVVYGHLKLDSIVKNAGDSLTAGEVIGILGKNNSAETAGERKHLHLGLHKGSAINILGYVQTKNELSNWLDPCIFACQ